MLIKTMLTNMMRRTKFRYDMFKTKTVNEDNLETALTFIQKLLFKLLLVICIIIHHCLAKPISPKITQLIKRHQTIYLKQVQVNVIQGSLSFHN